MEGVYFSSKPDAKVEFQKSCVCLRRKVFEVFAVVAEIFLLATVASKVFSSSFLSNVQCASIVEKPFYQSSKLKLQLTASLPNAM